MKTIRDLNRPPQIEGRVEALIVRGSPRDPARRVELTQALAGIGLADDRLGLRGEAELSTRQVTLIQAEHLDVIARLARVDRIDPVGLRRNVVVSGINLLALKHARLQVGEAVLEVVGPCQPCSRMEETIGPGGYAAMRGHGGMTARVTASGVIRVGQVVKALNPDAPMAALAAPRRHGLPLSSGSLQLRPFRPEDALVIMALNAEPSTRRWLPSHVYASAQEAQARVSRLIEWTEDPGHPSAAPYVLAVVESRTDTLIGHVGFSPLDGDIEVSYAIAEAARGQRWGSQALRLACDWGASVFGITTLVALTAAANLASRRTLEQAGFRQVAEEERLFQGLSQVVCRYRR